MFRIMKYQFPAEANSSKLTPPDASGVWEVHRIDTFAIGAHVWAAVIWKVKERP